MKLLVLGAGVLGSLLADELLRAGHAVSVLARGVRYETLLEQGLVLRHYLQGKTTRTRPQVIHKPGEGSVYDAVFCVLQYTQLHEALATLSKIDAGLYVLVGNNPDPDAARACFTEHGGNADKLLFSFFGAGGRRENGRVVAIHKKRISLTAGALSGGETGKQILESALAGSNIRLCWETDIRAWLLYHLTLVVPVVRAIYAVDGNLGALARDRRLLQTMVLAGREAMAGLKGIGLRHADTEQILEIPNKRLIRILRIGLFTPLGRLMAGDHAMSAKAEMAALGAALDDRLSGEAPERMEHYLFLKAFDPKV